MNMNRKQKKILFPSFQNKISKIPTISDMGK